MCRAIDDRNASGAPLEIWLARVFMDGQKYFKATKIPFISVLKHLSLPLQWKDNWAIFTL